MAQAVIQTAFIGDLLLSIPLLRKVKAQAPDEPLHLICRQGLGDFFLRTRLVDRVHEIKKGQNSSYRRVADELRHVQFSQIYSPHESFRSAKLARALSVETRVGFKTWWNLFFFSRRVRRPMALPDALRQLSLSTGAGDVKWDSSFWKLVESPRFQITSNQNTVTFAENEIPSWASMRILTSESEQASVRAKFGISGKIVAVAPGSIWATKRWPYYADLVRLLLDQGDGVVLLGGKEDQALCSQIILSAGGSSSILDLSGKTSLYESFVILTQAQHLFCNDSGVMHLGAVAGTPITAVFGPTTLNLGYRPWAGPATVVQIPLACRPCGAHGHDRCPIGTHECMRSIRASTVLLSAP